MNDIDAWHDKETTMTKEMIEKLVLERVESRVSALVEKALAEREAEILEILGAKPRHRGLLSRLVEKGGGDGN